MVTSADVPRGGYRSTQASLHQGEIIPASPEASSRMENYQKSPSDETIKETLSAPPRSSTGRSGQGDRATNQRLPDATKNASIVPPKVEKSRPQESYGMKSSSEYESDKRHDSSYSRSREVEKRSRSDSDGIEYRQEHRPDRREEHDRQRSDGGGKRSEASRGDRHPIRDRNDRHGDDQQPHQNLSSNTTLSYASAVRTKDSQKPASSAHGSRASATVIMPPTNPPRQMYPQHPVHQEGGHSNERPVRPPTESPRQTYQQRPTQKHHQEGGHLNERLSQGHTRETPMEILDEDHAYRNNQTSSDDFVHITQMYPQQPQQPSQEHHQEGGHSSERHSQGYNRETPMELPDDGHAYGNKHASSDDSVYTPRSSPGPSGDERPHGSESNVKGRGILSNWFGSSREDKRHDEHARMQAELRTAHNQVTHYEQRLLVEQEETKRRFHEMQREMAQWKGKAESSARELIAVHRELVEVKALSETRGKELVGSQVFLTKADSISVSELVDMARTLQDEAFQTAASVCDSIKYEERMLADEESQSAYRYVATYIGKPLAKLLQVVPDKENVNPLLVQIILLACLTAFSVDKIEKWHGANAETNHFLACLYDDIRRNENQAVSGRWRALTRARTRPSSDQWAVEFMVFFQHVKNLSGWVFSSSGDEEAFRQKLPPIFSALKKLRTALGEQFTSADIEVTICGIQTPFDPRTMQDEWGDARASSAVENAFVGGTTGVGLKRRVPHDEAHDIIRYETILPPKVVLISSLEDIAHPPPPRKRRVKGTGAE